MDNRGLAVLFAVGGFWLRRSGGGFIMLRPGVQPIGSFPPVGPGTLFDFTPFLFVNPYSFVAAGGIDPNTANGLHLGVHFIAAQPVPEPSSMALLALGSTGALGLIRARRRKTSSPSVE